MLPLCPRLLTLLQRCRPPALRYGLSGAPSLLLLISGLAADMKRLSGAPATPQVSQIYLIYKLKEDLALAHTIKLQSTLPALSDNSTPSLISSGLFAEGFSTHFFQSLCGYPR